MLQILVVQAAMVGAPVVVSHTGCRCGCPLQVTCTTLMNALGACHLEKQQICYGRSSEARTFDLYPRVIVL